MMNQDTDIAIILARGTPQEQEYLLQDSCRIGRDKSCDVVVDDPVVSAFHIEVLKDGDGYCLHDIHSTNGTYLDGRLVNKVRLYDGATIQLGKRGPLISFRLSPASEKISTSAPTILGTLFNSGYTATQFLSNFLKPSKERNVGHFTMQFQQAVQRAVKKKSKKFFVLIGFLGVIAIGALSMVWFQQQKLAQIKPIGVEIFYTMKTLELQIDGLITALSNSDDPDVAAEISALKEQHQKLSSEYDEYVNRLGLYDENADSKEQLILRMARTFGECEINAPPDFVSEVSKYIKRWQATDKLEQGFRRCIAFGYPKIIGDEFLRHNLPPQFMYLALQESGFDAKVCGPKTRYGIAKGMWQFIPRTARAYGLKVGPLSRLRRHDPRDDRHDFAKSTQAAASLIRDLYTTKAQGSGLLVLASYNWGIGNLQEVIEQLPNNPKERNFWNLVKTQRIPKQTYDFVFYIISAAVIGENPELFGFKFKNLLADFS